MITARPPRALRLRPAAGPGDSDAALAQRAGQGDDRAFEALYGRYRDPVSRYCRGLLRHDQDAEDAFQATMIRAHRALRRMDGELAVRPWLFRIAHNECLRIVERRTTADPLSGAEEAAGERPAERAETREELRQLTEDLLALPERQRGALLLREMSGLSHAQIAVALGTGTDTVKQLIHEARASLLEFGAGRSLACAEVQRRISDGDGRVLRARGVRAHLRSCEACAEFRAGIARRPRQLAALFPAIPAAAAERLVAGLIGGGSTAAAGIAGLAGAGSGAGLLAGALAAGAIAISGGLILPGVLGGGGGAPAEAAPAPAVSALTAPSAGGTTTTTTPAAAPARARRAGATPVSAAAPATSGIPAGATTPGAVPAAGGATAPAGTPVAGSGGDGSAGGATTAPGAAPATTRAAVTLTPAGASAAVAVGGGTGIAVTAGSSGGTTTVGATVATPVAGVTGAVTVTAPSSGGAAAGVQAGAGVPVAGVQATAGAGAQVGDGATVTAGATVAAPVIPPVTAQVGVRAATSEGTSVGLDTGPVAGLVPPVSVRLPLPLGRR